MVAPHSHTPHTLLPRSCNFFFLLPFFQFFFGLFFLILSLLVYVYFNLQHVAAMQISTICFVFSFESRFVAKFFSSLPGKSANGLSTNLFLLKRQKKLLLSDETQVVSFPFERLAMSGCCCSASTHHITTENFLKYISAKNEETNLFHLSSLPFLCM